MARNLFLEKVVGFFFSCRVHFNVQEISKSFKFWIPIHWIQYFSSITLMRAQIMMEAIACCDAGNIIIKRQVHSLSMGLNFHKWFQQNYIHFHDRCFPFSTLNSRTELLISLLKYLAYINIKLKNINCYQTQSSIL